MSLDTSINVIGLGDLKSYIEGSTTGTTTYDEHYNQLINMCSAFFNVHCDRMLKYTSYDTSMTTETDFDGNGLAIMYVNQFPIYPTTGVVVYISDDWKFTTDQIVPSSDVKVYADDGHLFLSNEIFNSGRANVRVIYSAGYTSSNMPWDVKRAALEFCQFFWNREQKKDTVGVRNESFEGGSRSYETDMPWSVIKLLEHHRSPRYG